MNEKITEKIVQDHNLTKTEYDLIKNFLKNSKHTRIRNFLCNVE